jgi:putative metal-binding protein/Kelch motif protein/galactose oxidase-like protein
MTGRRGLLILLAIGTWGATAYARELTFEDRVAAQKAIEQVFWNHRIWPKENPGPKPPLSAVLSDEEIKARVEAYLKESDALDTLWQRPIRGEELQAELDRMAKNSRDPQVLRELFDALGNDPFVIAETLVRQTLAGRLVRDRLGSDEPGALSADVSSSHETFTLPALGSGACGATWTPTETDPVQGRELHTTVWTGTEMIVWGGDLGEGQYTNTGGRYNPSTDTWTPTSTNGPTPRVGHTAVWTGTYMIIWGGSVSPGSGALYSPAGNVWFPMPAGLARSHHSAVWTGSQMIVWGGETSPNTPTNTGSAYTFASNTWATTTLSPLQPRTGHTAIWTGTQMLVWGGSKPSGTGGTIFFADGARYHPATGTWTAMSTSGAPTARRLHTAVWTGTRMLVFGGDHSGGAFNTGGQYDPSTDTWTVMSTSDGPSSRRGHTAVWTGADMIVWGGQGDAEEFRNDGGHYDPVTDVWIPIGPGEGAPVARYHHGAVWTAEEMIVWGGFGGAFENSGARYCFCPEGFSTYYRDDDEDGEGNVAAPLTVCSGVPRGYSATSSDCDDGDPNNWSACDTCVDGDGDSHFQGCDRYQTIAGPDCDDANASTHPSAVEINDGLDNQCAGDAGYGVIDELEGIGFHALGSKSHLTWFVQTGATSYETARATGPQFTSGCTTFVSEDVFINDTDVPPGGGTFYYLVRPLAPHAGSFGVRSNGAPRTVCP